MPSNARLLLLMHDRYILHHVFILPNGVLVNFRYDDHGEVSKIPKKHIYFDPTQFNSHSFIRQIDHFTCTLDQSTILQDEYMM